MCCCEVEIFYTADGEGTRMRDAAQENTVSFIFSSQYCIAKVTNFFLQVCRTVGISTALF